MKVKITIEILEDISREAQEKVAKRTPEERKKALKERTNILRGEVEGVGIGDDEPLPQATEDDFDFVITNVLKEIPWFQDRLITAKTINKLDLAYDDPDLISKLRIYASNQMDAQAKADEEYMAKAKAEIVRSEALSQKQTEVEIKQDDFHDM